MWNEVLLGFDIEEETVNFGSRKIAVCDSAVYETTTLAIISSNAKDETSNLSYEVPKVTCSKYSSSDTGVIVAVNESIIVFSSCGKELKSQFSFNAHIDCYVTSKHESFVFVILCNGDLHCFLLQSNENSIFLKNICNNKSQSEHAFVDMFIVDKDDECDLILTSHAGNIYTLKHLNLTDLTKAYASRTKDDIMKVTENIKEEYFSVNENDYNNFSITVSYLFERFDESFLFIGVQSNGIDELQMWSSDNTLISSLPLPIQECRLKKIRSTKNGSLIFSITDVGHVLVICPYTFNIIFYDNEISWIDFEIMDEEENYLLALIKNPSNLLQLISIPSFKIKFQIDVGEVNFLVAKQTTLDDLFYLEAHSRDIFQDNIEKKIWSSIHLKAISESQPEYRLERILKRGKFDEAEDFARNFNLDLQIVYKAHLQKLSQDIQPWTDHKISLQDSGIKFKKLLVQTEDIEFVGQCALNAISSDFTLVKEVLKYAENRIKTGISNSKSKPDKKLQSLYTQIRNSLLRLNLFLAVYEEPLTVDKWLSFIKINLIQECQSLLKQGRLNQVMLIWSSHICELRDQLTYEQTVYFIKNIPSSIPIPQILDWLQVFLPVCLSKFPEVLGSLISWCKEKVNLMELLAEPNWTEISVSFLKQILQFIRLNVKSCQISSENVIQSEYSTDSPLNEILFYIKILTEMNIMKQNYDINISIAEYTQANNETVSISILNKVPLEELKSFINGFFEQLILQKDLNADLIISAYVQNLVEETVTWWYWEEAPWEDRVAILVECIIGVDEKLKCILCILKHSPVPWSAIISNICEKALNYENPLTKLLLEQKKLVNCKLVLKKYDLKYSTLTKTHIDKVLRYIIGQRRDTLLEDALEVANTFDSNMCDKVYILYVLYLMKHRESAKLLSFLNDDNVSLRVAIKCCEHIILDMHSSYAISTFPNKYENCMEILDVIERKLTLAISKSKMSDDKCHPIVSIDICNLLKSLNYVKIKYKENLSNCSLSNREQNNLFKRCLTVEINDMAKEEKRANEKNLKLNKLAENFVYTRAETYLTCINLAASNQIDVVVSLFKLLLKEGNFDTSISDQFIDTSHLLLQHIIRNPNFSSGCDVVDVIHGLATLGLSSCWGITRMSRSCEIRNWCKLIRNPSRNNYINLVLDQKTLPQYSTGASCSVILKLLSAYGHYLLSDNLQFLVVYILDDQVKYRPEEPAGHLSKVLDNVVEQEQERVCFSISTNLHWSVLNNCSLAKQDLNGCSIVAHTKKIYRQCVLKLIKKWIGSKHLVNLDGLALFHHFSKKEAIACIAESTKRFKYDFQRLSAITELGKMYFAKNGCAEQFSHICKLQKQCFWGKQIMEYGLSYKEAFRDTAYDQKQLLLKLISIPSMNVDILANYCKDVNFNFQKCLKVYLTHTMLSWEPEFEVKMNTTPGEKEIVIKPTHKQLLEKCREIVSLIENKNELMQLLMTNIWDSVKYYYYEVFLILIMLLEEYGVKPDASSVFGTYRIIFLFLSSYKRISKPQEFEKDSWYQTYPNEQSLPPISEFRLPFKLLFPNFCKTSSEPWKIIQHELNINTYKKWLSILDVLGLEKNLLCTFTINQMMFKETVFEETKTEWCLHLRNQKLLANVELCVESITNLEMACASLYFVVNHLPPGADQLAAAKLCFMHAKEWREMEQSENSEKCYLKVQKKYLTIATTHILYSHHLGESQYLQLVMRPAELINAVYNDPIILQKNTGNAIIFPDINKAVEEISILHKIDISQMRMELLDEWLQPENFIANVSNDDTIVKLSEDDASSTKFTAVEYGNFQRACYVAGRDINTFGPYLFNMVYDQNSDDSKPISIRLRAIQCLYAVASEVTLEKVTGVSIDKIRNFMDTLKFVNELESLGLTYSVSSFDSVNKNEIVKTLLSLKNRKAIGLAAKICENYRVPEPEIWNDILVQMCTCEMVEELSDILPNLYSNYHTLDLSIFEKAWKTVLVTPLNKVSSSVTPHQLEIIKKCIKLINFCPIIDQIDLQSIKRNCNRINQTHLIKNIYNFHS